MCPNLLTGKRQPLPHSYWNTLQNGHRTKNFFLTSIHWASPHSSLMQHKQCNSTIFSETKLFYQSTYRLKTQILKMRVSKSHRIFSPKNWGENKKSLRLFLTANTRKILFAERYCVHSFQPRITIIMENIRGARSGWTTSYPYKDTLNTNLVSSPWQEHKSTTHASVQVRMKTLDNLNIEWESCIRNYDLENLVKWLQICSLSLPHRGKSF